MPVVLWNHVQDPLDVDKKKTKKELYKESDPLQNMTDTDVEQNPNINQQEGSKVHQMEDDQNHLQFQQDQAQINQHHSKYQSKADESQDFGHIADTKPATNKMTQKIMEDGGFQDYDPEQNSIYRRHLSQNRQGGLETDRSLDDVNLDELKKKFEVQQREAQQMLQDKFNTRTNFNQEMCFQLKSQQAKQSSYISNSKVKLTQQQAFVQNQIDYTNDLRMNNDKSEDSSSPKRPLFPSKMERQILEEEEALKQKLDQLNLKKKRLRIANNSRAASLQPIRPIQTKYPYEEAPSTPIISKQFNMTQNQNMDFKHDPADLIFAPKSATFSENAGNSIQNNTYKGNEIQNLTKNQKVQNQQSEQNKFQNHYRPNLNQTHGMFQSHNRSHQRMFNGSGTARDDHSQNSQLSISRRASQDDISNKLASTANQHFLGAKKIGGLARRQRQRQTTRELAEMKKRHSSNGSSKTNLNHPVSPFGYKTSNQINQEQIIQQDYKQNSNINSKSHMDETSRSNLQNIIKNQNDIQVHLKSKYNIHKLDQNIDFRDTALPFLTTTTFTSAKQASFGRNQTIQIQSDSYFKNQSQENDRLAKMQTTVLHTVNEEKNTYKNIQGQNNKISSKQTQSNKSNLLFDQMKEQNSSIHGKDSEIQDRIENQQDLEEQNQKMKIRRSKQSFQPNSVEPKESRNSQEFQDAKSLKQDSSQRASAAISANQFPHRESTVIRELKETQEEKERQLALQYEQRRIEMQKNFEREQQNAFFEKQNQILQNLEQIAALERELEIARLYKEEQEKKQEQKETIGVQTSKTAMIEVTTTSPERKNDSVLNMRNSLLDAPKVSISRTSNVQTNTDQIAEGPKKKGMVNNSQQINALRLDSNESLGKEMPKFKDQANDPVKRDRGVDAKARDVSTDPMVGEKSTDPKVQDMATDAWKRDGLQQTSVQSYSESLEKLGSGPITSVIQNGQDDVPIKMTSGGTQYNIEQAVNPDAESEKDEVIAKEENTLIDTVNGIFDEYDDDRSGSLNQEETCRLLDVILKNQGRPPVTIRAFNRFFKEYDINGDGVLSKAEMAVFVQQFLDAPAREDPESSMRETEMEEKKPDSAQKELALQHAMDKLEKEAEKEAEKKEEEKKEEEKKQDEALAQQEEVAGVEGSQSAKEALNRANQQSIESKIEEGKVHSEKLEGEDIIEATKPAESSGVKEKTSPLSMFIDKDSQKESQVESSPIYHDHLLDEVMNQRMLNQAQHSNDRQRNESRSTQQMFEHQFGARGKDRFKNKLNPNQNNNGNLTIINQSINQNLPQINKDSLDLNQRNVYMYQTNNEQKTLRHNTHQSPQQHSQPNNFDHFRTPKPLYGHQQEDLIQGHNNYEQQYNQMRNNNVPFEYQQFQKNQYAHNSASDQFANSLNRGYRNEGNHSKDKANCAICIERRQRRNQARTNNHPNQIQNNSIIQAQNNLLYSDASFERIDPSAHINIMSNATNSVANLQQPNNFQNFGQRNKSLPNQQQMNAYHQQHSVKSSFGQQPKLQDNFYMNQQSKSLLPQEDINMLHRRQHDSIQRSAAPISISDQDLVTNQNGQMQQFLNQERQFKLPRIDDLQRPSGDITHKIGQSKKQSENNQNPLNQFKGQELEMFYAEKVLKPEVEKEIKRGFFEIRKKFASDEKAVQTAKGGKFLLKDQNEEEVQVYVSHICLHNFHPIFSKLDMDTVKTILQFGSIVYLTKGQVLYAPGFNDSLFYVVLFGRFKLVDQKTNKQIGCNMNLGWTIGEEILFKVEHENHNEKQAKKKVQRKEICKSLTDSCVIGIEKKGLQMIKRSLFERLNQEEFSKIEIVLRGNHLVKKNWK